MRFACLLAALVCLPCSAGAADAVSALSLARAQVLAVQVPEAAQDVARGDRLAYRTLQELRSKSAALRADLPPDAALAAAWQRLDADIADLLDCRDDCTAQQTRVDSLAFVRIADALMRGEE